MMKWSWLFGALVWWGWNKKSENFLTKNCHQRKLEVKNCLNRCCDSRWDQMRHQKTEMWHCCQSSHAKNMDCGGWLGVDLMLWHGMFVHLPNCFQEMPPSCLRGKHHHQNPAPHNSIGVERFCVIHAGILEQPAELSLVTRICFQIQWASFWSQPSVSLWGCLCQKTIHGHWTVQSIGLNCGHVLWVLTTQQCTVTTTNVVQQKTDHNRDTWFGTGHLGGTRMVFVTWEGDMGCSSGHKKIWLGFLSLNKVGLEKIEEMVNPTTQG